MYFPCCFWRKHTKECANHLRFATISCFVTRYRRNLREGIPKVHFSRFNFILYLLRIMKYWRNWLKCSVIFWSWLTYCRCILSRLYLADCQTFYSSFVTKYPQRSLDQRASLCSGRYRCRWWIFFFLILGVHINLILS